MFLTDFRPLDHLDCLHYKYTSIKYRLNLRSSQSGAILNSKSLRLRNGHDLPVPTGGNECRIERPFRALHAARRAGARSAMQKPARGEWCTSTPRSMRLCPQMHKNRRAKTNYVLPHGAVPKPSQKEQRRTTDWLLCRVMLRAYVVQPLGACRPELCRLI